MITDLILPKFNMDMESAVLLHWLRGEGDRVAAGDPVAEVSTDKVNMEVEATADGILFDLRFAEGDTVPVSVPIARIASDESDIAAARGGSPRAVASTPVAPSPEPTGQRWTEAGPRAETPGDAAPGVSVASSLPPTSVAPKGLAPAGRIRATPAARRLARELGVDLATITSANRRITVALVGQAQDRVSSPARDAAPAASFQTQQVPQTQQAPEIGQAPTAPGDVVSPEFTSIGARQLGAASVWTNVRLEKSFSALYQGAQGALPRALWVYLVARALHEHPRLNSSYGRDGAVAQPGVHIAVEVAGPNGLVATLVCDADRRTLLQIDREIRSATSAEGRAIDPATRPCQPTFTIVDFSETDVDGVAPAPRAPHVATLGIGRCAPRVVAMGEGFRIEPTVQGALSFDPRAVHEFDAASFLATLTRLAMTPDVAATSLRAAASIEAVAHA